MHAFFGSGSLSRPIASFIGRVVEKLNLLFPKGPTLQRYRASMEQSKSRYILKQKI
jgi:hypothetical protein